MEWKHQTSLYRTVKNGSSTKRYQDNVIGFGQSRKECAEEMGIGEEEWMKMTLESLSNNYFSSALVILALHESATTYSHYDLGAFATNFMLAAE